LLKGLREKHDVTLLSFAFETAPSGKVNDYARAHEDVQIVERSPFERNLVSRALRFLSPVPIVNMPVPEMTKAVRGVLAQARFDVVIASTTVMATYALQAPARTVRVIEEHNSLTRWMEEYSRGETAALRRLRRWVSWQKTRYYESRLFRRFDLCVMVSELDRATCLHGLPGYHGPVEVVPNGVDTQHNRAGMSEPVANTLVYNGALTYSSNYDAMRYFLSAIYPIVRQRVPDVTLTITGSTSGVDLSGLALDESVVLNGFVDDVRIPVSEASICVVPLRRGGGTRLKILEAMALGTPVVTTTKGAEGLDVTPEQDILIADEPAEFASQVVRLLGDASQRRQLAASARHLVERSYDWSQISQRFACLVEEVASRQVQKA
jgi:glycosyltransferase involved in cell wall biosynthesis